MLDWLGATRSSQACRDAAVAIEGAVDAAFSTKGLRTRDIGGSSRTRDVAETVADLITAGGHDRP